MRGSLEVATIDLESLSAAELREHIAEAQATLNRKMAAERDRVVQHAEAELAKLGLSLAEAVRSQQSSTQKPRAKRQLKAKFRHPDNPSVTWSGVGRKPGWIREAEAAGTLDVLRTGE